MSHDRDLIHQLLLHDLRRTDAQDAADALDDAAEALPAQVPPTSLRDRLLAAMGREPFAPFAPPLATLFDVDEDKARTYLDRIPDPSAWEAMGPGIELLHFEGGPATAGADVGFVRVSGEIDFPPHTHGGEERNLILRGRLTEPDGTVHGPGDVFVHSPGSHHRFRTEGDLLFAVVVWDVQFDPPPDRSGEG